MLSLLAVCGDRLTLGVSPGSTRTDYATLDRDYATRFTTFRAARRPAAGPARRRRRRTGARVSPPPRRAPPPLLLGSWGANVERAARDFDGWLASGYRRTPDEIIAAHERYRAGGRSAGDRVRRPGDGRDDLAAPGPALRRYAEAGFDDAVVLIGPGGPAPEEVRALLPERPRVPDGSPPCVPAGTVAATGVGRAPTQARPGVPGHR